MKAIKTCRSLRILAFIHTTQRCIRSPLPSLADVNCLEVLCKWPLLSRCPCALHRTGLRSNNVTTAPLGLVSYAGGRERSRPVQSVVEEVRLLSQVSLDPPTVLIHLPLQPNRAHNLRCSACRPAADPRSNTRLSPACEQTFETPDPRLTQSPPPGHPLRRASLAGPNPVPTPRTPLAGTLPDSPLPPLGAPRSVGSKR